VRDEVWLWVRKWWREHTGLLIYEGHHDHGPFNRSRAINRASALAGDWDTAIVIDADVILDGANVFAALGRAGATGAPVLGYSERINLTAKGSRQILQGFQGDWRSFTRTRLTNACSSAIAVRRDLWDAVGGFDETFAGWGWEDVCFAIATQTVSGTKLERTPGTLWHLWHARSPENDERRATYVANRERAARYKAARWNRSAVLALLEEARDSQEAHPYRPGRDDGRGGEVVAPVPGPPPLLGVRDLP